MFSNFFYYSLQFFTVFCYLFLLCFTVFYYKLQSFTMFNALFFYIYRYNYVLHIIYNFYFDLLILYYVLPSIFCYVLRYL